MSFEPTWEDAKKQADEIRALRARVAELEKELAETSSLLRVNMHAHGEALADAMQFKKERDDVRSLADNSAYESGLYARRMTEAQEARSKAHAQAKKATADAAVLRDALSELVGVVERHLRDGYQLDLNSLLFAQATLDSDAGAKLLTQMEHLRTALAEVARRASVGPPDPPGPKANAWYNLLVRLGAFARDALKGEASELLD